MARCDFRDIFTGDLICSGDWERERERHSNFAELKENCWPRA